VHQSCSKALSPVGGLAYLYPDWLQKLDLPAGLLQGGGVAYQNGGIKRPAVPLRAERIAYMSTKDPRKLYPSGKMSQNACLKRYKNRSVSVTRSKEATMSASTKSQWADRRTKVVNCSWGGLSLSIQCAARLLRRRKSRIEFACFNFPRRTKFWPLRPTRMMSVLASVASFSECSSRRYLSESCSRQTEKIILGLRATGKGDGRSAPLSRCVGWAPTRRSAKRDPLARWHARVREISESS
jgi:hypothetical protein